MRSSSIVFLLLCGCNAVLGLEERPLRVEGGDGGEATSASGGDASGGAGGDVTSGGGAGGDEPNLVGNCMLDAGEACDDCNANAGDGCDDMGAVELGWVCPNVGLHCWRLTGLVPTTGTVLVEAGGNGGSAFDDACSAGHLLVGVDAHNTTESGSPALGQLRGRCAPVTVDVADFGWSAVDFQTPPRGQEPVTSLGAIECPAGSFATGLEPRSGSVIRGYKLLCAELQLDGTDIVTTVDTETGIIGTGPIDLAATRCPSGSAASAFTGRSGALIDRLIVRCDPLVPTYCGNAQTDAPFETCDDGNVTDGDGCDSYCQLE